MTTSFLNSAPDQEGSKELGHRRHLVIVFSDLSDSTHLSAALEPEVYSDLLQRLRVLIAETVSKHGGEIIRIDGDGVVFVFGYPSQFEDAGRRAVEAALDLHHAADQLKLPPARRTVKCSFHTGIHSGTVLISKGDLTRGRYEILGEPTNVAARLCDFAAAGEIIVSDVTLGADQHFFHTGQPRNLFIRGRTNKVLVRSVQGRAATPNRFSARLRRIASPFAGREEELERLRECSEFSNSKGSRLVIISGDAGIGKTRLVNEFLSQLAIDGHSVHQGYCEAYLGARPLQPFAQLALSILAAEFGLAREDDAGAVKNHLSKIDAPLAEPLMQLLSLASAEDEHSTTRLQAIPPAIVSLLNAINTEKPIAIFIDDWQWADQASVRVLDYLLDKVEAPTFVILAARSADQVDVKMTGAEQIGLGPLTTQESQKAVESLLQSPVPFTIERIRDQSGGNPLFIEELCHSLQQQTNGVEDVDRTTSLEMLIYSRFARLPQEQNELVKAASVVGHMIPLWLLDNVSNTRFGQHTLSALSENDFIHVSEISGILRFKHGITRDVIYDSIDLEERVAVHQSIVDALHRRAEERSEDEQYEMLAYHYAKCGNAERACHYATLAGDKALAESALDRAQAQYRAVLAESDAVGDVRDTRKLRNAVVRKFGLASVVDPSWDQLPVLTTAADRAASINDAEGLAWAEYWLGFLYYGLGEPKRSIAHLEAAKRTAQVFDDPKLNVQIGANLGQSHATACEYDAALELLNKAIEIKRAHRSGKRASIGLSYSLSCKGFVLADQAKFDEAYSCFDDAIDSLSGVEHEMTASVLTQRSASCIWQGKFADAIEYAKHARQVSERVKARYLYAMSIALISAARLRTDDRAGALDNLLDMTGWLEANASHQFISLNHGWLSAALVDDGQIGPARRHAAHAILRARKGDRLGEAMAYRAMARAAAKERDTRSAERYLHRAYCSAAFRQSPHENAKTRLCEAEIAISNGETKHANSCLAKARATFESFNIVALVPPAEELEPFPNQSP